MPLSPAQRDHQKKLAALAVQKTQPEETAPERIVNSPEELSYRLLLQSLGEYDRKIQSITNRADKIAFKREIMPEFIAHIDGLIEGMKTNNAAVQDEIFAYYMVWSIDVGDYEKGLEMAALAFKFDIKLPHRFKSELQVFIIETFTRLADDAITLNENFPINYLVQIDEMLNGVDLADQKRAKLYKSIGLLHLNQARALKAKITEELKGHNDEFDLLHYEAEEANQAQDAYEYLKKASSLHQDFGAKSELKSLAKRFNPAQISLDASDTLGENLDDVENT